MQNRAQAAAGHTHTRGLKILFCVVGLLAGVSSSRGEAVWQANALLDSQFAPVSEPVFRTGEQNVLIIHGFNSGPRDMQGIISTVEARCANVLLYQYPSAVAIGINARHLYAQLTEFLRRTGQTGARFSIVAYSEGGLVARAAIEPGPLNGNNAFGDQVERLVTLATPHTGIIPPVDLAVRLGAAGPVDALRGVTDMLANSEFLMQLNSQHSRGQTRYYAIGGSVGVPGPLDHTDGLVHIDSALPGSILPLTERITLQLKHSASIPSFPAVFNIPSFPNEASVYPFIDAWIFTSLPAGFECPYVGGEWQAAENGSQSCTIGGMPERSDPFSGAGNVTIMQTPGSCDVRYQIPDPRVRNLNLERAGTLRGFELRVTGPAAAESGLTFGENTFTATGKACGAKITLDGVGKFSTASGGVNVACTTESKAEFVRRQGVAHSGQLTTVSAASFEAAALSPNSIASAFTTRLASRTEVATGAPGTTLGGVSLAVTDSRAVQRSAHLFFVSPNQVSFLVPAETASGLAGIVISSQDGRVLATGEINVQPVAPGLFSANANGTGVAAGSIERIGINGIRTTELTFTPVTQFGGFVLYGPAPITLGPEFDRVYLTLYGTGLRGERGSTVRVSIGSEDVPVLYAGPQSQYMGLDQINIGPLPRTLIGRGELGVVVDTGDAVSNVVTLSFGGMLGFQPTQKLNPGLPLYTTRIGDLDGDGLVDVVSGSGLARGVSFLRGNGDGTFRQVQLIDNGAENNIGVGIADVNKDGIPDLITAKSASPSLAFCTFM